MADRARRRADADRITPLRPDRLWRHRPFRALLVAACLDQFAASAMTILLGFQVYAITHNPFDLGLLGLVEAIPGISLVLYGGHMADRHSRRRILLVTSVLLIVLASGFAVVSTFGPTLPALLLLGFANGIVRAFDDPAASGLEAQVVPLAHVMQGVSLVAVTSRVARMIGPVIGGFAWDWLGPAGTYAAIALLFTGSWATLLLGIPEQPLPSATLDARNAGARIVEGLRYVWRDQILLGSMALDLFAVFFGGATALLPVFATDILHVGPVGFGLLRSASAGGSLVSALLAGRFLPQRRAGRALFLVIGGFGASMVVFGLSRSLPLSLVALFTAGLCDGTSVVIRRAILRLASPDALRGRIAAVKSVFVGSSNELGAFESGMLAGLIGASASVWTGGLVTLGIVLVTAWRAPLLRRLDLARLAELPQRQGDLAEQAGR